ncbi:sperm-associated antigen 8-like [Sinocyclocheilus anshuiensis]|uniref:sperm-associated antigen 8-like n=1 Tax=Sinocyclocheilus anshuiensis TaxID=1608454 RepID=UPI0007B7CF20|nr:PREDICTED: sperm-associated antigen 8-like [Sinocyclocheilus anshuiensis]
MHQFSFLQMFPRFLDLRGVNTYRQVPHSTFNKKIIFQGRCLSNSVVTQTNVSAMTSEVNEENEPGGRCLLGNWVEERATALLDRTGPRSRVHKYGHTGILTMDVAAKVQGLSTFKAAFNSPKSLGVLQKGRRAELLENDLIKIISDQIHAEMNTEPPAPELCSVTKADYKVEGFKSVRAPMAMDHDYTTEQAITFWSDNYQKIQGVTTVKTKDHPFKINATFSTPIGEQLDQLNDTVLCPSENTL